MKLNLLLFILEKKNKREVMHRRMAQYGNYEFLTDKWDNNETHL